MYTRKAFIIAVIISVIFMNGNLILNSYAKDSIEVVESVEIPVVNINTATAEELQLIKGIGPKLAARIINYREENGTFSTVDDLMQVRGIGSSKFEKIKENLKV